MRILLEGHLIEHLARLEPIVLFRNMMNLEMHKFLRMIFNSNMSTKQVKKSLMGKIHPYWLRQEDRILETIS